MDIGISCDNGSVATGRYSVRNCVLAAMDLLEFGVEEAAVQDIVLR